jgi:N-acetylglutamate synthase-like GNAT family acetyltransferase
VLYRIAQADDFHAVQKLLHQLNPDGDALSATLAQWSTILNHPGTSVWLADNGEPIACMTLHILPNLTYSAAPYAVIENVVTREDYRGQGIGRELMLHVLEHADRSACYKVMLLTGGERGAKGFYRACGFSETLKTGMVIYRNHSDAAKWQRGE